MNLVGLPAPRSLWVYPAWNNPEYAGPWEVEKVGVPGEESASVIVLRRVESDLRHETPAAFWPGGWVSA